MKRNKLCTIMGALILLCAAFVCSAAAQSAQGETEEEFGPVVRAYLGYLRNEQEVVDDRVSRREVSPTYYRRNSNRIRALRQMAIRIARETGNDYLPELEAAARDELKNLFEKPPRPATLSVGEVYNNTFRFLGRVQAGEIFYLFARLDPYEQAELMDREKAKAAPAQSAPAAATAPGEGDSGGTTTSRPRRASSP